MNLEARPYKYTVHEIATGEVVGLLEMWGSNLVAFSYDGRPTRDRTTRLADRTTQRGPRISTHLMRPLKRSRILKAYYKYVSAQIIPACHLSRLLWDQCNSHMQPFGSRRSAPRPNTGDWMRYWPSLVKFTSLSSNPGRHLYACGKNTTRGSSAPYLSV